MDIDFAAITNLFRAAEKERRSYLFEHEVYRLLAAAGIRTARHFYLDKKDEFDKARLKALESPAVVVKIVSPLIVHKSDVGGVHFLRNDPDSVAEAVRRMYENVPARYAEGAKKTGPEAEKAPVPSAEEVRDSIRGVLVMEKVSAARAGFGSDLLMGIRNSREFGPVVTVGAGGLDVEFLGGRMKDGLSFSFLSAHLLRNQDLLSSLKPLAVYDKLLVGFRGRRALLAEEELEDILRKFKLIACAYSALDSESPYVIEEAEVNPFVVREGKLIPLDGVCRFSKSRRSELPRPWEDIRSILRPESIAVIGVSEKINLGRIILKNILRQGFPKERTYIVKPGLKTIDGCRCVPEVKDLPETVDLFIFTLGAEHTQGVMEELIAHEKARAVIIIAGGLGEKKGTQGLEEKVKELILRSRQSGRLTPLVNGGNCLGIYSKPGKYDTTFIPEHKLTWPKAGRADLVFISQSGAFMVSRMSKIRSVEPLYAVSLGNQLDLTASDYLNFLGDDPEAGLFALYIEGFRTGDGLALAEAAAAAVAEHGKQVLVYKAGRTAEGRHATSSHTASVAGDYNVSRAVLESVGVYVAETIYEFESAIRGLTFLAEKQVRGNRVALISNAGFECVIMSDSLRNLQSLALAEFSEKTKKRLLELQGRLGIDRLQDIRNPLDLTPVADDEVFCESVRAVLEDEDVDCAVVSPVPMTPAMQTLPPGLGHDENLFQEGGTVDRLSSLFQRTDKPFVVNVDAGATYQPLVEALEERRIPVFRQADDAVKFLRKFVHNRLLVRRLRV